MHEFHPANTHRSGFSLLEISVVIAIIALVIGMSISGMQSMVDAAKVTSTNHKINAINDALHRYWVSNKRLPCPADASLVRTNANYGLSAANNNAGCTGGTPAASKSVSSTQKWNVEGMVPFRTLGLSEGYALDGWDSRITYATTPRLTADNAATYHHAKSRCRFTTLHPLSPENFPAYVVLSHGKNRFGARSRTGVVITGAGATTTDGSNAHLDIASPYAAVTYTGEYYTNYNDPKGDDVMGYKTLWDLNKHLTTDGLQTGKSILFFSSSDAPYSYHYAWDGDSFVKQTNFTNLPGAALEGKILASPDHEFCQPYLVFTSGASSEDSRCQYRQSSGAYASDTACIAQLGPAVTEYNSAAFRSRSFVDATHGLVNELVYSYDTSPYLQFEMQPTLLSAGVSANTAAYQPNTPPAGIPTGTEYSPVNGHLAVSHATTPFITIYDRSTSFAREKLADPLSLPTGDATDVAYSPDGQYLAVSHAAAPYVTIYYISGDNYIKIPDPDTLPSGNAKAVSFSHDSKYMVVGHAIHPFITVYAIDRDTGIFTVLEEADNLPSGTVNDVDFAAGDAVFGAAISATAGNKPLMLYRIDHGEVVTELTDIDTLPATGTTGHAIEFADEITTPLTGASLLDGLTGWWKLDEGSGVTAKDFSGNGRDATLTDGPTWSADVPGAFSSNPNSMSFDGINDYMIAASFVQESYNSGSMSLWYKNSGNAANNKLVEMGVNTDRVGILTSSTGLQAHAKDGNVTQFQFNSDGVTDDNQWHHAVLTWEDNAVYLYVDGVLQSTSDTSSSMSLITGGGIIIGKSVLSSGAYTGLLDDVRVYNRVLSAKEIEHLYTNGR